MEHRFGFSRRTDDVARFDWGRIADVREQVTAEQRSRRFFEEQSRFPAVGHVPRIEVPHAPHRWKLALEPNPKEEAKECYRDYLTREFLERWMDRFREPGVAEAFRLIEAEQQRVAEPSDSADEFLWTAISELNAASYGYKPFPRLHEKDHPYFKQIPNWLETLGLSEGRPAEPVADWMDPPARRSTRKPRLKDQTASNSEDSSKATAAAARRLREMADQLSDDERDRIFEEVRRLVATRMNEHPLNEAYQRMLRDQAPHLARLTLARPLSAAVLAMWKHQQEYDVRRLRISCSRGVVQASSENRIFQ